jgi:uncharacterized damage-inducible protein DinB
MGFSKLYFMSISQSLLPEFDHEMATTRKLLERVPEDKADWKPHTKSMSMSRLAGHVATLPEWTVMTIKQDELEMSGEFKPFMSASPKELTAKFDELTRQARAVIAEASDADLMKPWSLKGQGKTFFTMPKVAVLRSFVMNHMIHHRGQLSVYLRLNDVPVPSMYGPSADESSF